MNDKVIWIIKFLTSFWIFTAGIITFGIACALISKGIIDTLAFTALLTTSLYTLDKNKKSK